MISKQVTLQTRPFQAFLLASDDLLKLAHPYFQEIEEDRRRYSKTHRSRLRPHVWQREKSLSIGSFMTGYAGLEAFISCAYNDFNRRNVKDLPEECFLPPLDKHRKELCGKLFGKWRLDTRTYLLAPLCSETVVDPRSVFDINSDEWKMFQEVIGIRHSFNHPAQVSVSQEWTRVAPKFLTADDSHPSNFWPLTGAPKDHRILNYSVAEKLRGIILGVISRLRKAMPSSLDDKYMTEERVHFQSE